MTDEELTPRDDGYLVEASVSDLAARIRDAIGAGPDEDVIVRTPQFERTDGVEPAEPPLTERAFEALRGCREDELSQLGLRPWSEDDDLWLLPAEWYPHIPPGVEIVDILGRVESFEPGVTDDDRRHGHLAYGIVTEGGVYPESSGRETIRQ